VERFIKDGRTVFLDPESGKLLWSLPVTNTEVVETVKLPNGWLCRTDPSSNTPYYFNTINWKAQWTQPRLDASIVAENMKSALSSIPHPYEVYFDVDGNPYYHNIETGKTYWEIPQMSKIHEKAESPACSRSVPDTNSLPEGWEVYFTDDGEPYYYCRATDTSYWEIPDGVGSIQMDVQSTTGDPFEESIASPTTKNARG
jgi:outer membrane protein assembly factor BamB